MSKDKETENEWTKLSKSMPGWKAPPPGYLNPTEFGKRAGVSHSTIFKAVKTGKIHRRHCIAVNRKTSTSKSCYIRWNKAAYSYILSKPEKDRPADFVVNDAREYKPFAEDPVIDGIMDAPPRDMFENDEITFEPVTDLNSAKYRREQLAIMREQAAQKLGNNETILVTDAAAVAKEFAIGLKAETLRAINAMIPKLVPGGNAVKIRGILLEGLGDAFEAMERLGGENEE